MFFCGNVATHVAHAGMDMVGARCRHVAFLLYNFLNEYYTDLEFLMDFMNIFLYNFFKNILL